MAGTDPLAGFQQGTQRQETGAEEPAEFGVFDAETWSAAWKSATSGEDWGLNQSRYMGDAVTQIMGELKKRGYQPHFPSNISHAGIIARQVRGQPYSTPRSIKPGDAADQDSEMFRFLSQEQKRDPKFLPQFSGIVDRESLYQWALNRRKVDQQQASETLSRASSTARFGAGLATGVVHGLTDPTSYIPLPGLSGPSSTALRSVLKYGVSEAAANVVAGVAMEPFVRADAKALGQDRTIGDTLEDLSMQAAVGGVIGGVGGAVEHFASPKAFTQTEREAVSEFRNTVDESKWTPNERAAVNVIERNSDIVEASPYAKGWDGDTAHLDGMAVGTGAVLSGHAIEPAKPVRRVSRQDAVANTASFAQPAVDGYMARVRRAESSGNDTAAASTSTAYGRYQFTKGTWISYFKRRYPASGLSNDQILAKRADGAMQDLLMRDLTNDNARALKRAGLEADPASLYIMHFAGPDDGVKILRAGEGAPIEGLMRAASIQSNTWLRGMTAGELRAMAERKMGGQKITPVIEPDQARSEPFEMTEVSRDYPDYKPTYADIDASPDWLDELDGPNLRPDLFSSPEEHARAQIADRQRRDAEQGYDVLDFKDEDWRANLAYIQSTSVGTVQGALYHPSAGSIDISWSGDADLIRTLNDYPGIAERLPDIIEQMDIKSKSDTGIVLQSADSGALVRLVRDGDGKAWRLSSFEERSSQPSLTGPDFVESGPLNAAELQPVLEYWRGLADAGEAPAPLYAVRIKRGHGQPREIAGWTADRSEANRRAGTFENAEVIPLVPSDYDIATGAISVPGFDGPHSPEAQRQTESLEHDLRMVENPDELMILVGEDGEEVSLSSLLDSLDEDDAANAALRSCLAPRAKAA